MTDAPSRSPASSHPPFCAAAIAVGMVLLAGAGYRLMARHLARPSGETALTSDALAQLPLSFDGWSGRDMPLTASVVRATGTDAHVNRTYRRRRDQVGLFLAYGIRARDLAPHRPEVCYPGSGWTLQQARPVDLPAADGSVLPCTLYRFNRGGGEVGGHNVVVLNFYIVDGRICPDVSGLRRQAWRGPSGIRYLAQVQITCAGDMLTDLAAAESTTVAFAHEAAPRIRALFPAAPLQRVAGGGR